MAKTDQRSTRSTGSTGPKGSRPERRTAPRTDAVGSPTGSCGTVPAGGSAGSPDTAESVTEADSPDTAESVTEAGSPDTAESVTEAISLLESFVSSFEPRRYSGEDAAVLIERFSRGEHLCATGKALAAKRATEADCHRRDGARSAAEWLSKKTGESVGASAGALALADQMEDHPVLDDALRTGELSTSRARQVAGVLKLDPDSSEELVEAAKDPTESHRQLADRCLRAKAKARSTEDALAAYERIRDSRYLRHYTDSDGAFRLEGLFTPDAGAKVLAALRPARTALFDEARRLGIRERPDAYDADALVALLTGERRPSGPGRGQAGSGPDGSGPNGTGPDGSGTTGGQGATGTGEQAGTGGTGTGRTGEKAGTGSDQTSSAGDPDGADPLGAAILGADALGAGTGTDTGTAGSDEETSGPLSPGLPPPASVHLRVDLAALRRGSIEGDERCELPGVGPVPIETARSLLGDAILHLVITKGTDIASITYLGRTIRAPLEQALIARDETCVVPGCDVRQGLQIDHRIIPVVEGGPTALWNLARLCGRHHYMRHHKGFRLEGGPGTWQWLPPEKPPPRTTTTDDPDNPDIDGADPSDGSRTSPEPDRLF